LDQSLFDALVRRLVENPYDEDALAWAHREGSSDPGAYAGLLEQAAKEAHDRAHACHWFIEAANVYIVLDDFDRARDLMELAVVHDPMSDRAANSLAELHRHRSDIAGLIGSLEVRARLLESLTRNPEAGAKLDSVCEELRKIWAELRAKEQGEPTSEEALRQGPGTLTTPDAVAAMRAYWRLQRIPHQFDAIAPLCRVVERDWGWIFPAPTSPEVAPVGVGPLLISRIDGSCQEMGTAYNEAEFLAKNEEEVLRRYRAGQGFTPWSRRRRF
jgi:hypothetical protein